MDKCSVQCFSYIVSLLGNDNSDAVVALSGNFTVGITVFESIILNQNCRNKRFVTIYVITITEERCNPK